ncbi:MAG: hypothetical protein Q9209_006602 [Squamulea sp. 1 TL-2023]
MGNLTFVTPQSTTDSHTSGVPALQNPKPSEPYFIVPPGFRPNTFFVGMEKELLELDRRLFDKRRHDGTACVLLHGQPGGGKSHLARQYMNKNRKKFPGGVFWIVSHFKEERDQAYEAIFQKVVARESPDASTKLNESGSSFVDSVKAWFETRQEWLLVFDGLTVDTDADLTELARFVPDSRNSSLIFVSRQSNLASKQRLLRPYAVRVPVLKLDDARKLLLKELHIKKPSPEEIQSANKLVKQIDCLPLAINAVSHRINEFREPLTRYSMKSFSANPKLEGTYNQILDDLQRQGHMEAWSLINILAFFGQHVPVEMLHLGAPGLQDVQIRSREGDGKPELNFTFGTLMRHALLERNEPDSETSSSRDSLVEPEPIDMLKIHSVVQSFCRDSLNARNMLPEWLQHASQLLERSFHAADFKIKQKDQRARVSDYRYYHVSFLSLITPRLFEHATQYETKRQSLAPVRAVLEPLLETIEMEIRSLEPGSSQESVVKMCQVSIFDRTTSSSDSVPSIPPVSKAHTPHRPSPLLLAQETLWGTDIRKPSLESPASIRSARGPRIAGNSPYQGSYDDFGYESDRETPRIAAQAMRKNISERTERPQSATREEPHQGEGWQVVSSNRRYRKPRIGRDLGSFRPTPARATRAEVDRRSATGTIARSTERAIDRESSEARKALSEVHSRSPTPPRRNLSSNLTSFWQRRPLSNTSSLQRTWADVVAGQEQYPRVQPLPPTPVPPIIPPSPTHLTTRQGNPFSSPLASEIPPDGLSKGPSLESSAHLSAGSGYEASPPQTEPTSAYYPSPAPGSSANPPQPRYINNDNFYNPTPIIGSNPARLSYTNIDDLTSRSVKRRLPSDLHDASATKYPITTNVSPPQGQSLSQRPSAYSVYEPSLPNSNSYLPPGYYSQPMSRDTSHQSYVSAAETEPLHHPTPSSVPRHRQRNASFSVEPPSPRDRYPNGRPMRKSPRSDFAVPVGLPSSNNVLPHDLSQSLPGLSGGAYDNPKYPQSMSRSSSGPGVAIENSSGYGLGIIPFDGHLRFGEHEPISVEDAQRRTLEWERRLTRDRDLSRGRERRRIQTSGPPYPDERAMTGYPELNLIPTQSSPEVLKAMVGERGR